MMERVRCFFCLPLTRELTAEIAAWIDENRALARQRPLPGAIRWVSPANLHVTLRFCGEISAPAAQVLGARVEKLLAERRAAPLRLSLRKTGTFGRPIRVLWAGLGGDTAALGRLNDLIEDACREAGLPPNDRKFSPHLTLARMNKTVEPAGWNGLLPWTMAGREWTAGRVIFMRSRLTPAGPRYEPLTVCRLAAADGE